MNKILENKDYNYNLYQFDYILKNKQHFIKDAELAQERFLYNFPSMSSTKMYRYYNFFSLTAGSISYSVMFRHIKDVVRDYCNHDKPLWLQSWINFHRSNQLLDWHQHSDSTFHGYVCIEPKDSTTIFSNYTVKNAIGQIYIGPSYVPHKVISNTEFDDIRITLGFDIFDLTSMKTMYDNYGAVDINIGMIPL